MGCGDLLLAFVAVLFPPIAVWVKTGLCSADSCINILLCMLGYFPGLIHAWYIIARHPEFEYDHIDDPERQERVTYYYISHEPAGRRANRHHCGHGYGAIPQVPGNKPLAHHPQYQSPSHQPQYQHQPPPHSPQRSQPPQQQQQQQQQQSGVIRSDNAQGASGAASSSAGPPPSYSEAVKGDHKIQHE